MQVTKEKGDETKRSSLGLYVSFALGFLPILVPRLFKTDFRKFVNLCIFFFPFLYFSSSFP